MNKYLVFSQKKILHTSDKSYQFCSLISARKLRLGEGCGPGDECADPNAGCGPGYCDCNPGFSRYRDICGKEGAQIKIEY